MSTQEAYEDYRKNHPNKALPEIHEILEAWNEKQRDIPIKCDVCDKDCTRGMNNIISSGSIVSFSVGYGEWDDCMNHGNHFLHVCLPCLLLIPWLDKVVCADR